MHLGRESTKFWVVGLLAFGGLAGCGGPEEPAWQFDQADMEAALFGTWTGTITPAGGETAPFTLTIRSHDDVARTPQCGSRDFSGDDTTPGFGTRCIESTSLAVSATVVGDGAAPAETDGQFLVFGTTFHDGDLYLTHRTSEERHLHAHYQEETWRGCEIRSSGTGNEQSIATCTLDERIDATE